MTLLERLKKLCDLNGETFASLEKKLNFGNATIRKWDTATPSGDRLAKVADFFNVSVDYLLGRESNSELKAPPDFAVMARKTGEMSEEDRQAIYKIMDSTIDVFLAKYNEKNKEKK